jgi:hypothetical protein
MSKNNKYCDLESGEFYHYSLRVFAEILKQKETIWNKIQ